MKTRSFSKPRRSKIFAPLIVVALVSNFCTSGFAQTTQLIAGWDFQTTTSGGTAVAASPNTPTLFNANVGSGALYLNGSEGSSAWLAASELNAFGGTSTNAGPGMSTNTTTPAALAVLGGTSNAANGKFVVFKFSMTGYANLAISFAAQRTSSGFSSQLWEWSTNGSTWNTIGSIASGTTTGSLTTSFATSGVIVLPTTTGLDNAATAYVRVTFAGASAASGNNRLDNIQFVATSNAAPTIPAAPVISAPSSITTSGFTANWQASSGATKYYLDVTTDSGFSSFVAGYNNLDVGGATSQAVTSLSPATTYYYRVRASNSVGTSSSSQTQVALTASLSAPVIAVSPASITNFSYIGSGPSAAQSVSVTASNLTGSPGSLAVSGATNYEVSTASSSNGFGTSASIVYSSATLDATNLWIRLKGGLAAGSYTSETVSVSGGGAASPAVVTLGGTVTIPTIGVTTTNLGTFTATNALGSASKTLTVSGSGLVGPVGVLAPTNFQVGLDTNSFASSLSIAANGALSNTAVLVRVSPSAPLGALPTNQITLSSTSASNRLVQVTGSVVYGSVGMSINGTNSVVVNEGDPALTLDLVLSDPAPVGGTTVNLTSTDNDNSEITISPTSVIFAQGETTSSATVTPLADTVFDVDQTVVISASATNWVSSGTVSVRVVNVDPAPPAYVSLTSTNTNAYTQNFNSLGVNTLSNAFSTSAGVQTSLGAAVSTNLDGWYGAKLSGNGTPSLSLTADYGNETSGTVYNYGSTNTAGGTNLNRSLGSLATGSTTPGFGAVIRNDTGTVINSIKVSVTAKFWRSSTSATNVLTFAYGKIDDTTVTISNFLSTTEASPQTSLNIVGPNPVVSNGPLDGNNPTNQRSFVDIFVPAGLTNGEAMFIRWQDFNDSYNDAGLAIDDLSFTASTELPPADGLGTATTVNGDGNSPLSGQNIFSRNLADQTVQLSFVPANTPTPTTALRVTVPAEWGAPAAANVSVTGSGTVGASVSVSGQVITITGLSALYPDPVGVLIAGLSSPDTALSVSNSGRYSFAVQSQGSGGSLAPINSSPVALVTIPIANARSAAPTTFVPTLLGQTVAIEGVANVGKLGFAGQINSSLQDAAYGIGIYSTNVSSLPERGNRYFVSGSIGQTNGLVRINITNYGGFLDVGPTNNPVPVTVTVPQLTNSVGATNGINLQSRLIKLENLSYVSGNWALANSVILRDAASNNVTVYIQGNSTAVSPPTYPVTLTGIAGQYDTSSPYDTGFQIQPRDQADAPVAAPTITSLLTATADLNEAFSYQITATDNPPATSYDATPLPTGLFIDLTTGLIYGTPIAGGTFNVTISATNAGGTGSATLVLNVGQAGSTFTAWAQGAPLNSTNLLKYAVGGATSPTATNGLASTSTLTSINLSITAAVRTNDPSLSTLGAAVTNLVSGTWSTSGVSMTPATSQTGVPEGCQIQTFSTPRGSGAAKFLRLQSTLTNQ
jgi:hypothetical protein